MGQGASDLGVVESEHSRRAPALLAAAAAEAAESAEDPDVRVWCEQMAESFKAGNLVSDS